jgi:hypothetical protein
MANLDDLNATLQDVVRAVNNLNETLGAGLPPVLAALAPSLAGTSITVQRGLLELCLGIVQEVEKTFPSSVEFAKDLKLAEGQLKAALGE